MVMVLSIALGVFLGTLPLIAVLWWLLTLLTEHADATVRLLDREFRETSHRRDNG